MREEIAFTPPLLQPTWFKCLTNALFVAIVLMKELLVFQFMAVMSCGAVHTVYFEWDRISANAKLLFRIIAIESVLLTLMIYQLFSFRNMILFHSQSILKLMVGDIILIYVLINSLYVSFIFSSPIQHYAPELTVVMQLCLLAACEYTKHVLRVDRKPVAHQ